VIEIRNYGQEDLETLVALINAADAVDRQDRSVTREELVREMARPGHDPARDMFLAVTEQGRPVGYVALSLLSGQKESMFRSAGVVHPDYRRRGVGRRLMEAAQGRAQARLAEVRQGPVYLQCVCDDGEEGRRALFESLGLRPVRYFLELVHPSLGERPEPDLPAGFSLRTYQGEEDLEILMDLDRAVFADHWAAVTPSLEEWRDWVNGPEFRPELWLMAFAEGESREAAGFCLCEVRPQHVASTGRKEGYVGDLGVRPQYRGRGLGLSLLRAGLGALRDAGMESAYLHVDVENSTGATGFYRQAGFQERRREVFYWKALER